LEHQGNKSDAVLSQDEAAQRDATLVSSTAPKKLGVLVVDDEHLIRILVQLGLERSGFDVWVASTGPEAIDLYTAHRKSIAVVLLDVQMQDLDGPQTLDALQKVDPAVPVCFMSADTGKYQRDELLQRGAACVIPKPFRVHELSNVLRLVANGLTVDFPTIG
jgi:CheY-like chemotaxis protein